MNNFLNQKTPNEIAKILAEKIKQQRKKLKISQESLAFQVGVDRTYISAIEQGQRSPSLYCLFVIAKKLNANLSEIVNFKIEKV